MCYFNRYTLKLKCIKRLKNDVKIAFKKIQYKAWFLLHSPTALAVKKMELKKKKLG